MDADPIQLIPTADGRFYLTDSLNFLTFRRDEQDQRQVTLNDRMMGQSVGQH